MVLAFVLVTVKPGTENKVEEKLSRMSEVVEIYKLFGEWDVLIKVSVAGTAGLNEFITGKLRRIREVRLSSTLIASR